MRGVVLAVALVFAACSATPETPQPLVPLDEVLFGTIVAVDPGGPSIMLDLAEWLEGEEAEEAARAEGRPPPSNPYFIRDLHERRTYPLDREATVVVMGYDADGDIVPRPIPLSEFARLWRMGPATGEWMAVPYHWVSIKDGIAIEIAAQYTP